MIALALLAYSLVFLGLAVVLRAYLVKRRIGASAIVLATRDDVHTYLSRCIGGLTALVAGALVLPLAAPGLLSPFAWLERPIFRLVGAVVLVVALTLVVLAQSQMGTSWRIGLDHQNDRAQQENRAVVERGLYRLSRHPIYLGVHGYLVGLFLCLPNVLSLLALVVGHVLLQLQARVEEAFMTELHGDEYRRYARDVPRWCWRRCP